MDIPRALKARAAEAGAAFAGIAPAEPFPEAAAYKRWISSGMHGSMDYMARNQESRENIAAWYPEAKSVLVCAFAYAGNAQRQADAGQGRVARYAALPDYHPELKRRMEEILAWLKARVPEADGRIFVDTSPLLERLYARYAGLGWIGKNTMVISPKAGSYFFLAGLAVNIPMAHDEPAADHCGSCSRCIESCPTEALSEDRVLDASRCIAYFTIEHKGRIPAEFRSKIGNWIMGCDVCQEVCPWNRFAGQSAVFPPALPENLPLNEFPSMDKDSFRKKYGQTPLSRPKLNGLVRNSLLAMGNSRDASHRPILEEFAANPDPILSEQAAWSLARISEAPPEARA
ncbi:MAG: tRNA epoxyqueuosine(34) reductase QueG [Elusimicrobia bacterium]|nr:tRNA epoxyqueuosine(34) reductase QueG [Elusimicrobiota bacterium]MDE2314144.1 tRNA epoxyqueuosine(34) reductase QueG [Elusimicrobiota bacterium]